MGSVHRKFSGWMLVVVVGAGALSLLAMACAPPSGGGPVATTTTTTSTTLPWTTPTGQWSGFDLTCYFSVFGTYYDFPQSATANVEAPITVSPGQTFNITVTPGPFTVPTVVQGFAVQNVNSFTIRYALSPNVRFVDSVMSAGFSMGPGYPSLSLEGGYLVYRVPGPFAPGSTVQMPRDRLTFTATGAPGSTIETRMESLSNVADFGTASVGNTCIPNNPNLVFTTTIIR